ncbi:MAG: glycosyltransferase family 4 protein [Bacteroides sp.]|nr:glycosyltransferase family 4 protein [Bacteroides sp.]
MAGYKKIGFVVKDMTPPVTGGAIYEDNFRKSGSKDPSLNIEVIPSLRSKNIFQKILSPLRNLLLCKNLREYDLICFNSTKYTYFLPLLILLRMMKKKTMIIHHHFAAEEFNGLKKIIYGWLENSFLKTANYVLTPSPYIKSEIKRRVNRDSLLCLIPFDKIPENHTTNVNPGKLLFIGTVEARKGLIYLVNAMKILKRKGVQVSLDILGKTIDERYKNEILNVINEESLDVTFRGYVSKEMMDSIKAESDIFVFPSLLEGYGMAINEAMAYGLPVITFNNSAMPYSVTDGINGFLIPTGSSEELAKAIEKVVTDRNLRYALSQGAIAHAQSLISQKEFESTVIQLLRTLTNHSSDIPTC